MHQLQRSWVRWFDPSIRRHSGIWGAADEAVLNLVRKKLKYPPKILKKKILVWKWLSYLLNTFVCLLSGLYLSFLSLYLFPCLCSIYCWNNHVIPCPTTHKSKDAERKILAIVWAAWQVLFRWGGGGGGGSFNCLMTVAFLHTFSDDSCILPHTYPVASPVQVLIVTVLLKVL